ncbi:MAG: WG repeat-containing protein [Ruminococcaceae bacterium]|nr:WG repeat-containing protein [Oscillospiraceae bacterium]
MKKAKHFLAVLALILSLCLCACGGETDPSLENKGNEKGETYLCVSDSPNIDGRIKKITFTGDTCTLVDDINMVYEKMAWTIEGDKLLISGVWNSPFGATEIAYEYDYEKIEDGFKLDGFFFGKEGGKNNVESGETEPQDSKAAEDETGKDHIVEIGRFHDGLARATVYIYDEGYYSSEAAAYGYHDGYFLYGYMDVKGNMVIKPIYSSAPEILDGMAFVEIYEGVNQSRTDIIDAKGNSMLPVIGDLSKAESYGEITNGILWVKTVEKTIAGNTYTVTYYNKDGKMFSFENTEIAQVYYNSDENSYSNFYGERTLLTIDGITRIIDRKGQVYQFEAIGFEKYYSRKTLLDIGVTEFYDDYLNYWYPEYVEVDLHIQSEDGDTDTKTAYGKIDWENKTIACVDYDEYIEYSESAEKLDKNWYSYAFDELLGVDVEVTDIAISYEDNIYISAIVRNTDGECFSILVKEVRDPFSRSIILQPTQDVQITSYTPQKYYWEKPGDVIYQYRNGLCLAKDTKSGLFGYLNTDGKWAIEPQYQKAGEFSEGYAIINRTTVIDTTGKVVFSADR